MVKRILVLIFITTLSLTVFAHDGYKAHVNEIKNVFGITQSTEFDDWAQYISQKIDKHDENGFYKSLKSKFNGFSCKHRLLFHWGYNSKPWSNDLEKKTKDLFYNPNYNYAATYGDYSNFKNEFLAELRKEQQRRNAEINKKTEDVFGFAHGGIDAKYANRFASIAYNVHLLGDYEPDNTDLVGLPNITYLLTMICQDVEALGKLGKTTYDGTTAKEIVNMITQKSNEINENNKQQKASEIMMLLQKEIPPFLKTMSNGSLGRRLEKAGFQITY